MTEEVKNNEEIIIRDFLYFDYEKAVSIFSQLYGGLITGIEKTSEDKIEKNRKHNIDLKIYKPEFGKSTSEKATLLESKILHHDLYNKVESKLFDVNFAIDINNDFNIEDIKMGKLHNEIKSFYYIKCEGIAFIEDYTKIKNVAQNFNRVSEFIGRCTASTLENSDQYKLVSNQLSQMEKQAESETNKGKKQNALKQVKKLRSELETLVREISGINSVPEWLIQGMGEFIDIFMLDRINLRIYPYSEYPLFNIIANLKRNCFVDSDIENLLFAYGSNPNVKLSIFGLITALPELVEEKIDTSKEFEVDETLEDKTNEQKQFEKGFRGLFRGFEGLEQLVRYSRYPNITIYPIAVYRNICMK